MASADGPRQKRSAPADELPVPQGYRVVRVPAPTGGAKVGDELLAFLQGFGPHFDDVFGRDFRVRLREYPLYNHENPGEDLDERREEGDGSWRDDDDDNADRGAVLSFIARHEATGAIAAHAAVLYSARRPAVGALFNVLTGDEHRRRGLAAVVVRRALHAFDREGGEVCVLGTGSPHAAKVYAREGFVRLAGRLEGDGPKGYNPGDSCEFIMVRVRTPGGDAAGGGFDADAHYALADGERASFVVVPASREHFPELALLFFAREGAGRLPILGIADGVLAEEPLTGLALRVDEGELHAHVAVGAAPSGARRVHGLLVARADTPPGVELEQSVYVYPGPAAATATAALKSAAEFLRKELRENTILTD